MTGRKVITKTMFFEKEAEIKKQWVDLSEFYGDGQGLYVKVLSGIERDEYDSSLLRRNPDGSRVADTINMRAKLVAACACDESGNRIFDFSDVVKLGKKSSVLLGRLHSEAQRINEMGRKEVEQLLKNYQKTMGEDFNID